MPSAAQDRAERWRARLAAIVSFSSFFVFPAVPVGRSTAITVPVALAALLAILWLPRLKASEWWPYAWLIAPALASGWYVIVVGSVLAPQVVPRSVAALAMSLVVIVPALRLLRGGYREPFVLGAACAILVHAALGAYQVLAFDRLEFPFLEIMRTNPEQALLAQDPGTYVEYVKRPFGLFAEASAMAACVGPWLVVITSVLFSSAPGQRSGVRVALLAAALASGMWLVVASKSGQAAVIIGGTALTALGAAFSWRRSIAARGAALVLGAVIAVSSAAWLSQNAGTRFDLTANDSWQARLDSLGLAVHVLGDSIGSRDRFLGGVGPGQSYAAINSTGLKYQTGTGVTAVWSVGINYALENGVLAVAAMILLGACAAWSIWASRERLAGAACGLVWLSGVFVATSYLGQPSLWTGLAALLSWRSITGRA